MVADIALEIPAQRIGRGLFHQFLEGTKRSRRKQRWAPMFPLVLEGEQADETGYLARLIERDPPTRNAVVTTSVHITAQSVDKLRG